jgi:hypothetical protein
MSALGNREGHDMYEQIFAGVRTTSDLQCAIARAVRQLREAMEKEDNCAVTGAHLRNLTDISPDALARAYSLAEKTCTYWPSPGQIRELAGWSEESRGGSALEWVFSYLEKHAVVAAPALPAEIKIALALLGSGSTKQGLRYVSQHPVVKGWDNFSGDAASRSAERIERQWMRCYLHAIRIGNGTTASSHPPPLRRTQ